MSATPPVLTPDGSGTGVGAAAAGAAAVTAGAALSPGFGSSAAIAGSIVPATSVSAARHSIHFVHFLIYPVITFSFFIPADPEGKGRGRDLFIRGLREIDVDLDGGGVLPRAGLVVVD